MACSFHLRLEIDGAMFDLWAALKLSAAIARDAKKRCESTRKSAAAAACRISGHCRPVCQVQRSNWAADLSGALDT
jgi:hypothetical protein